MLRLARSLFFVLVLVLLLPVLAFCQDLSPIWEVYFSPKGGCSDAIVREITKAKSSVLVQAYSLKSDRILNALVDAHKHGVRVKVILDKSRKSNKYSEADFMVNHNLDVRIDSAHAIAHDKTMVLDGCVVITGSFNFSKKAEESNAENVLIIRDEKLAGKYADNWRIHWEHSQTYKGKSPR